MTTSEARWEQLFSEYVKNSRLPDWESPPIPVPFAEVDSACSRFVLRAGGVKEYGIEVDVSEPDTYHKVYSLYVLSNETDNNDTVIRLLPKECVGTITINKIRDSRTQIAIKATGHDNNLFRAVVTAFLNNWLAEREIDRSGYWQKKKGAEGETAVAAQEKQDDDLTKYRSLPAKQINAWASLNYVFDIDLTINQKNEEWEAWLRIHMPQNKGEFSFTTLPLSESELSDKTYISCHYSKNDLKRSYIKIIAKGKSFDAIPSGLDKLLTNIGEDFPETRERLTRLIQQDNSYRQLLPLLSVTCEKWGRKQSQTVKSVFFLNDETIDGFIEHLHEFKHKIHCVSYDGRPVFVDHIAHSKPKILLIETPIGNGPGVKVESLISIRFFLSPYPHSLRVEATCERVEVASGCFQQLLEMIEKEYGTLFVSESNHSNNAEKATILMPGDPGYSSMLQAAHADNKDLENRREPRKTQAEILVKGNPHDVAIHLQDIGNGRFYAYGEHEHFQLPTVLDKNKLPVNVWFEPPEYVPLVTALNPFIETDYGLLELKNAWVQDNCTKVTVKANDYTWQAGLRDGSGLEESWEMLREKLEQSGLIITLHPGSGSGDETAVTVSTVEIKNEDTDNELSSMPWLKIPDHKWDRKAVQMMCEGHTDPEIAESLKLASKTITNRLSSLRRQFPNYIPSRSELRRRKISS